MLRAGKKLAFADEILISIYPSEIQEIGQFIKQLQVFGLLINLLKWCYLAPQQIHDLNNLGQFKTSTQYLGVKLTYDKTEQIKNSIKNNALKLRKFNFILPITPSLIMEQAQYKSLALCYLGPTIIANEINFKDVQRIVKSMESKIRAIPVWCNSELFQAINSNELTLYWIRRILLKKILN